MQKGPQAVRIEPKTRPSGVLTIGPKTKTGAGKKPVKKDMGGAAGGFAQHLEVDKALTQTMHKDLTSGSSSQMPLVTLSGEKLGFLEHYAHEWNAAEMGMVDGKSIFPAPSLSQMGAPPSDQPEAPVAAGDRFLALKALMLEVDTAIEV